MAGINNLAQLLKKMKPSLQKGEYVFCTLSEKEFIVKKIKKYVMKFEEKEGVTLILEKNIAVKNKLAFSGSWSWIILTVHSDLAAVGFLAAITKELAASGISVNAVSAYYHDHLFVPIEKAGVAMQVLRKFSL